MSNIFFTSDHHFGHANIIKYSKRPFENVDAMDEALIARWNAMVEDGDTVYHLGDFTLGNEGVARRYVPRLNGKINLVQGGHDYRWVMGYPEIYTKSGHPVKYLGKLYELYFADERMGELPIVLCHYAMMRWERSHHGAIHLFGHSHGHLKERMPRSMDVGVDCHNFFPITIDDVIETLFDEGTPDKRDYY